MRIGILGGSFDPFHNGHLKLALAAKKQFKLHTVYFLLSPQSPFKSKGSLSSPRIREKLLVSALTNKPHFKIARWELKRKGPSYTVKTLSEYKKKHPTHDIFFIMGSDGYKNFYKWKNPQKILSLCHIIVGKRPNKSSLKNVVNRNNNHGKVLFLKGTFPLISSTEIRGRIKNRESIHSFVPKKVEQMINKTGIYL
ncbi:MAG: nicotinate-nucleotide adenylyltransferase [Elusimicrobiota bacterium]